jgi:adenine-specific DNA methylase
MPAFIETQFPIARLSAESFKERKAVSGQTLTGLGKWWGRKPLILIRASILGMLMPASDDAKRDRDVFLKILTMDDEGAWARCKPAVQRKLGRAAFDALPYAERISTCERPENATGPRPEAWAEINAHLGTTADSLPNLVEQLGQRTFGHTPRVGDSFCGGGSIPFEAARIGCEAFGSDLNPVAGLLTWASLNLLGGGEALQVEMRKAQADVFAAANRQITDWGVEHNERGERAEAYIYCVEVKPEGCDFFIPLAPSWLIDEYSRVVVKWQRTAGSDHLHPEIAVVSDAELKLYKERKGATAVDSRVVDPFDVNRSWSVEALRGPEGLRRWTNDDVVPRPGDVFQERLYCIRWIDAAGNRRYAAPDPADLAREAKVLELLRQRFTEWQDNGFIPSKSIPEGGDKTEEPIRTRGWTYWHHLFTPRQLLTHGLLANLSMQDRSRPLLAAAMLNIGRLSDWNSRLSCWLSSKTQIAGGKNTFLNQALNPLFNYSTRPLRALDSAQISLSKTSFLNTKGLVKTFDARDLDYSCDLWITDPPYADAVNYHELGDFFLAWYEKQLAKAFPEWIPDARAELAVRGDGEDFRRAMVDIYQNLARHMPDNGLQMVQFTHQDPAVWADLGMILWAAGLKATAAWTISTETEAAGIKKGNYVQGTVCLVLRKRSANEPGFLDEVYPLVEDEVKRQIASMQALDEGGERNFNDADYQLAAYAAALKVLTQYGNLDGRDVEHEVFAVRDKGQKSDFQGVIERALGIACDVLIPQGLGAVWRDLSLAERYYLRALDIESRGERRNGMYEELARGFGVTDIKPMLKSDKANGARMYTPSGLAAATLAPIGSQATPVALPSRRGRTSAIGTHPFAVSSLRHLLFAIRETAAADNSPDLGRQYLRDTFGQGYWALRERFVGLLEWLAQLGNTAGMDEWRIDSDASRILAGRLRNDHA